MKSFLLNTIILLSIAIAIFIAILCNADGYTDAYYLKFTTPPQDNLIIGTSRSAQGLQPAVFNEILKKDFFNYSFTLAHSPFGPVYYNSILKKLNKEVKNGIFVIAVDPWSISNIGDHPNDSSKFFENDLMLAHTYFVNMNPNLEYLIEQCKGKYYTLLRPHKGHLLLHRDGWLEVSVPMDSATVKSRLKAKIEDYKKNNLPHRKLSAVRLRYLMKTVNYLKQHGKVYLVRLPVSAEMLGIEQQLLPNFNQIIDHVVIAADGYLDMTKGKKLYQFVDGNHIWKESGKQVSMEIALWIKQHK